MANMNWGEMIRKAIAERNGKLAEGLAIRMHMRWGMTYAESDAFVRRHAPEIDPEELFRLADESASA